MTKCLSLSGARKTDLIPLTSHSSISPSTKSRLLIVPIHSSILYSAMNLRTRSAKTALTSNSANVPIDNPVIGLDATLVTEPLASAVCTRGRPRKVKPMTASDATPTNNAPVKPGAGKRKRKSIKSIASDATKESSGIALDDTTIASGSQTEQGRVPNSEMSVDQCYLAENTDLHYSSSTNEEPEAAKSVTPRQSVCLSKRPTIDRYPARQEGIHLPQTREQISAAVQASKDDKLERELAKVNAEAEQQEQLKALMTARVADMLAVNIELDLDNMDVDKREPEPGSISSEDEIIDVRSSDIEDAVPRFPSSSPELSFSDDDHPSPAKHHKVGSKREVAKQNIEPANRTTSKVKVSCAIYINIMTNSSNAIRQAVLTPVQKKVLAKQKREEQISSARDAVFAPTTKAPAPTRAFQTVTPSSKG
jgi:hypothetical protein